MIIFYVFHLELNYNYDFNFIINNRYEMNMIKKKISYRREVNAACCVLTV